MFRFARFISSARSAMCKPATLSAAMLLCATLTACQSSHNGALRDPSPSAAVLVPLGGGIERTNAAAFEAMLQAARTQAKGAPLRIVIAPFASGEADEAFERARDNFLSYEPKAIVDRMADSTLGSGQLALATSQLAQAHLVFMTGGDQSRLTPRFRDARGELNTAGLQMFRSSLIVAGTSAGAAIMANPMFTGGGSEAALARLPNDDPDDSDSIGVRLGTGLGVSSNLLIDTHVLVRGRFGRMFAALMQGDHLAALGLADASGAIVWRSEDWLTCEVLHDRGAIFCWFENQQERQRIASIGFDQTVGARVSLLNAGDRFEVSYGLRNAKNSLGTTRGRSMGTDATARRARLMPRVAVASGSRLTSPSNALALANELRSQRIATAQTENSTLQEGAWDEAVLTDLLLRVASAPDRAFAAESERFIVRVWADEATQFFEWPSGAITVWGARVDIRLREEPMLNRK
jgi:cyanophycinase